MKKPSFAITSFILSLVLFIPASLVFLEGALQLGENSILTIIAFPFIVIATLPEIPLYQVSLKLGFPVVLPTLATLFAIISLKRKESKRRFAIASIVLVLLSIGIYMVVRNFM
ncbi:hypothetical protein KKF55_06445 [Patescibacteria group bacterium]|nr:hypothetical protein [Patescibacteria group bacterium]